MYLVSEIFRQLNRVRGQYMEHLAVLMPLAPEISIDASKNSLLIASRSASLSLTLGVSVHPHQAPVIESNKQVNPTRVSNNTVREVTSFARLYVIVAITPVKASVTLAFASEWRIHSFTNASVFHA